MKHLSETTSERLRGPLARVVRVEPGEAEALLLSFAYFFLLLSGYYILQPLRDALGLAGGVKNLPWLLAASLGVMVGANSVFSGWVARLPRRRFIPLVYRVSMIALLAFWVLLAAAPPAWLPWVGRAFFLFVGVYNLFIVSVFWGFMADLWRGEQGKRLFGFVGAGGTLGQMAGSALTAQLAGVVDPVHLLLVTVLLLEGAVRCVRLLVPHLEGATEEAEGDDAPGSAAVAFRDGLARLVSSPYLMGICLYLFLYTFTSSFLWFAKMAIVADAFPERAAQTAFFAQINLVVSVLTVTIQLFLTGRLLPWLGLPRALALVPTITLVGFLALAVHPGLAVFVVLEVARKASNYALARPAREILYTVVGRVEKYQVKSFIDTFVYRGGDAVAAGAFGVLVWFELGLAGISLAAVPVSAAWLVTGVLLGRAHGVRAAAAPAVEAGAAPADAEPPARQAAQGSGS